MDSESADEPACIECPASGSESASGTVGSQKRQFSLPEMVRKAEVRKDKRKAPRRSGATDAPLRSGSPSVPPQGGEGRPGTAPAPQSVQLDEHTLAAIKVMIDQGNEKLIRSLEVKLEGMERRIGILEGESMDKDAVIRQLSERLQQQTRVNEELQQRIEDMDMNSRLSSLIFTCEEFATHPRNADMEEVLVRVLNERIPGLNMNTDAVHAAHKLQNDNKVICRFNKRQVRDKVYDSRFDLGRFQRGNPGRDGRRLPPLYISESLTPKNRLMFEELLRARRPENGCLVASVFSRRGYVWCRAEKGGANVRIPDEDALCKILRGRRFPPGPRPARRPGSGSGSVPSASSRGGPPRAPSAVAPAAGRGPVSGDASAGTAGGPPESAGPGVVVPGRASGGGLESASVSATVEEGAVSSADVRLSERNASREPSADRRSSPGRDGSPVSARTRAACVTGRGDAGRMSPT